MYLIAEREDFGENTCLYYFLLAFKPILPCSSPYLDEGCQHPFVPSQAHLLSSCSVCQSELLRHFNRVDSNWISLLQLRAVLWIVFCYRMYIISHREMPCLCSLNQYSYLLPQQTLQKLPLLLAKVRILKILEIVFLFSLSSCYACSSFCEMTHNYSVGKALGSEWARFQFHRLNSYKR